jgi:Tol biopolymer transport system component
MRRALPTGRPTLALASLTLTLALAAAAAAPALATFPGRPGPIVYSRSGFDGVEASGGLFAHGPRLRQQPRQLTHGVDDETPSFSADGRQIVFAGDREALPMTYASHIYVMRADGANVRQLTEGVAFDRNPSFSPDGRRIVFDRTVGSGRPRIYMVNADGSGLHPLTDGTSAAYEPVFTPNGRRIVYVGTADVDARTDHSDIFAMAPSGASQRVLIDGVRNETEPDVSPNGRRIVFVSNRSHGPNLFVARANGRHVRRVTHSRGDCFSSQCFAAPVFSPDGRHIAFVRIGRYSSDLAVARPDGSHSKEFDEAGTEEEGYGSHIASPTWGGLP